MFSSEIVVLGVSLTVMGAVLATGYFLAPISTPLLILLLVVLALVGVYAGWSVGGGVKR